MSPVADAIAYLEGIIAEHEEKALATALRGYLTIPGAEGRGFALKIAQENDAALASLRIQLFQLKTYSRAAEHHHPERSPS